MPRTALAAALVLATLTARLPAQESVPDFATAVLPVLERSCFACHGANEDDRATDMRLDVPSGFREDLGGYAAVVPGEPERSELFLRLRHEDPDLRMPPADTYVPAVTDDEVALLRRWIEAGAPTEASAPPTPAAGPEPLRYGRDVAPLLASRCFACHGPDEAERATDMRLDLREEALRDLGGHAGIVPGHPERSEILRRVRSEDPDLRMPPPEEGDPLTAEEIALLERWIAEGASYESHWAFEAPRAVEPPAVADLDWPRGPLDRFVLARLEAEGLEPSPEADRRTLLRRLSLDLTGLPPTREEIEAFDADTEDGWYERLVDRLLASPHFGERMALPWLDAARYADTNGYHHDYPRVMWPWRDWVVRAFNDNKPYDRFVVEQLAGDLLPDASRDQKLASGFNRNHMVNNEGGAIPEEYQVEYVVDRVRTTAAVFMGLTLGCAQCHDHKYDPISNEEYFRFFAFFNRVPEKGLDGDPMAAAPSMRLPDVDQERAVLDLERGLREARAALEAPRPELEERQRAWEEESARSLDATWTVLRPGPRLEATGGAALAALDDLSVFASGQNPSNATYRVEFETGMESLRALWLEVLMHPDLPEGGPARNSHGNFVLSEIEIEAAPLEEPERRVPVKIASVLADYSQSGYPIEAAIDGDPSTGWAVDGHKLRAARNAILVPEQPLGFPGGTRIVVTIRQEYGYEHTLGNFRLSGTSDPSWDLEALLPSELGPWSSIGPFPGLEGRPLDLDFGPEGDPDGDHGELAWTARPDFEDGKVWSLPSKTGTFYLRRRILSPEARRMRVALGSDDALAVYVNGRRVHRNDARRGAALDQDTVELPLEAGENLLLLKVVNHGGAAGFAFRRLRETPPLLAGDVTRALRTPRSERDERLSRALRDAFRSREWDAWPGMLQEVARHESDLERLRREIPRVMVMADERGVRDTRVLERGRYDQPGELIVGAGVPGVLPPLPEGDDADRLDLARWLVRPDHPLTARVFVNRVWMLFFGRGLVTTPDDFGVQGARPSHPELLDRLATDFVASGWDVKALVRDLVTSSTYRQSSVLRRELADRDPLNELLARAPSFRLDAEHLRDVALRASGLLVEKIGGPPVKPYQPPGLWAELTFNAGENPEADVYRQDSGEALRRRGIYTFWKRSCPPPAFMAFDAPTREVCNTWRSRTNTPLQALVTWNDPTWVEAARHLAGRMLREAGPTTEDRVAHGFELATTRRPDAEERAVLARLLDDRIAHYADEPEAAAALLGVGDTMRDESLDPVRHAAWTAVASVILNLDETLTRR